FASFSMIRPPPIPTLFPYTTLFRSGIERADPDSGNTVGDRDADQAGAARERVDPYAGDAVGDRDIGQAGAAAERPLPDAGDTARSEEHTSELQSPYDLVCRLLLEKK